MTSESPYNAPNASLNESIPLPNESTFINKCDAALGFQWFIEGIRRYLRAPVTWSVIGLVNMLMMFFTLLLSLIPLIGMFIPYFAYPIFVAGLMKACANQDKNKLKVEDFFAGFSEQSSPLLITGLLYLLMSVGAFIVSMLIMLVIGVSLFNSLQESIANPATLGLMTVLLLLIMLALTLPILMAIWFAPTLVILNRQDAIQSIKLSFVGCVKNMMPYLVYGIVGLVFFAVLLLLPALLMDFDKLQFNINNPDWESIWELSKIMGISGLLFSIIGVPILYNSVYASYLDIYRAE